MTMIVDKLFNRIGPLSTLARLVDLDHYLPSLQSDSSIYSGAKYADRLLDMIHNGSNVGPSINWNRGSGYVMRSELNWMYGQNRYELQQHHIHPEVFQSKIVLMTHPERAHPRVVFYHEADEHRERGWLVSSTPTDLVHRFRLMTRGDWISDRFVLVTTTPENGWYIPPNAYKQSSQVTQMWAGAYIPYSDYDDGSWDQYEMSNLVESLARTIRLDIMNIVRSAVPATAMPDVVWHTPGVSGGGETNIDWKQTELSPLLLQFVTNLAIGGIGWALAYNDQRSDFQAMELVVEWLDWLRDDLMVSVSAPVAAGGDTPIEFERLRSSAGSQLCAGCAAHAGSRRTMYLREFKWNFSIHLEELDPGQIRQRDTRAHVCPSCRTSFSSCNDCGVYFHMAQSGTRDKCVSCSAGATRRVPILNYSFRPAFQHRLLPDQTMEHSHDHLLLGIEIEMEINTHNYSVREAQTDWLVDLPLGAGDGTQNEFFYPKSDASISHGFELCTHPFTPEWAYENFPFDYFDEAVAAGKFLETADSIGQHIHVARTSFTRPHLARFLGLHGHAEKFVQMIGGRPSTNYARWDHLLSDHLKNKDDIEAGGGVYQLGRLAVNLGRTDTIELRYPQGVASGKMIRKNIEWLDALYSFTQTLTNEQYELVEDPGYLMFWIASHPDRYGTLQSFIDSVLPRPKPFDIEETN